MRFRNINSSFFVYIFISITKIHISRVLRLSLPLYTIFFYNTASNIAYYFYHLYFTFALHNFIWIFDRTKYKRTLMCPPTRDPMCVYTS